MSDDPALAARHLAARLAARAQIEDVRLLSTRASLERQPVPPLTYRLDTDARLDYEEGGDSFVVACSYDVVITDSEPSDDDESAVGGATSADTAGGAAAKPSVVEMRFEYAGLFSLNVREGDDPISLDELQAYAATTGQFALYPYARQYVYDLTGRLGLPPLTVGVLRLPYEPDREGPRPLPEPEALGS